LRLELAAFRAQAESGLPVPTVIPPVIRRSRNLDEWYRRQVEEALAMFKISPTNDRMAAVMGAANAYQDAAERGRIRS